MREELKKQEEDRRKKEEERRKKEEEHRRMASCSVLIRRRADLDNVAIDIAKKAKEKNAE